MRPLRGTHLARPYSPITERVRTRVAGFLFRFYWSFFKTDHEITVLPNPKEGPRYFQSPPPLAPIPVCRFPARSTRLRRSARDDARGSNLLGNFPPTSLLRSVVRRRSCSFSSFSGLRCWRSALTTSGLPLSLSLFLRCICLLWIRLLFVEFSSHLGFSTICLVL
ncbi:hypothetical protein GW17_00024933 [Ensete ventricosum]|nr:hypothetical protein GW17_00024933 [Ensete ventricosum]RZS12370.1 hypothetical protein BHM03_00043796 [Ensete ventricosum]